MNGRVKDILPIRVSTATAIAAAGTTRSREFPEVATFSSIIVDVNITAISGSGATLTVGVEEYDEVSGTWNDLPAGQMTAMTTVSHQRIQFSKFGVSLRWRFVAAGTSPSIAFTVGAVLSNE